MNSLQLQFLMLIFAGWVNRSQQDVIEYLQEENRVLREQLGGRRSRFTDGQRRRLAAKAKTIGRKGLFEIGSLVTPDTLLRWYRRLIARKYDGSKTRKPGRPKTAVEIEELIIRMARDSPRWGYTRIRGALYNLGHESRAAFAIEASSAMSCRSAGQRAGRRTAAGENDDAAVDPLTSSHWRASQLWTADRWLV
jgi:hypothetical protein